MNDPDSRLAQLWRVDEPPARDTAFVAAVSTRIEHRRLLFTALEGAGLAAAGLAVVWAAWPFVSPALGVIAPGLTVAAAVGLVVWSVDRTFERLALAGYEDFTRDFASD
jgi:hypothetical protein